MALFGKQKSLLSRNKCRTLFFEVYNWYKKNWRELFSKELDSLERDLKQFDQAIVSNDRAAANAHVEKFTLFKSRYIKKSPLKTALETIFCIAGALAVALVLRLVWFESMVIPTGSMRPTYREEDHLFVSKDAFALNIPGATDHLYFDPALLERTDVVIWSGDGIDLPDTHSTFLGVIPWEKRYIKRLMGQPGDTVYFYGGELYTLDRDGQNVTSTYRHPWMERLDHVPILSFEGERLRPKYDELTGRLQSITFEQMHQPIGRLTFGSDRKNMTGEVFDGKEWIKDDPQAAKTPHEQIKTYSDFFGISNYAKARLLTPEQYTSMTDEKSEGDAKLVLELQHTPYLSSKGVEFYSVGLGRESLHFTPHKSYLPLNQAHLDRLMDTLYTIRFVVTNQRAVPYGEEEGTPTLNRPVLPGVPDGTYEFYYGKLYQVGWMGFLTELPDSHPLASRSAENIQKLFNLGIEMHLDFDPARGTGQIPSRFAYFRNGDFYVMGGSVLNRDDPTLKAFLEKENAAAAKESAYVPFVDRGPPSEETIRAFGVKVPEDHYLLLGDNYSRSADSRIFGFVPSANLQGVPSI
ncbi:MAG: signal peptidase I, partial [Chlamydiia bacterium]|nr:signal peptidase I [Chlamydiia bacterium]